MTDCLSISVFFPIFRDYFRGGSEGALAPPEFGGSEKRTEGETDNVLLIAPRNQNPNVVPDYTVQYPKAGPE